jgi:polysaccharide lyase-like protein
VKRRDTPDSRAWTGYDLRRVLLLVLGCIALQASACGSSNPRSVPANASLPVVSGTTIEGNTLSVTPGTWSNSPTSYSYQWQDCDGLGDNCVNSGGPTSSSTYTLMSGDVAHTIRVAVTAANSSGSSTPAVSSGSGRPSYNASGGTPMVISTPIPDWQALFDRNWGQRRTEGCNSSIPATNGFWGLDGKPGGPISNQSGGVNWTGNGHYHFTSGTSSRSPAFAGEALDELVSTAATASGEYGQRANVYLCPVDPNLTGGVYTSSDSRAYEGSDAWYRMEVYLADDFTPDGTSGWNNLIEFHQYPNDYGVCCAEVALGVISDTQDGGPAIKYNTAPYGRISLHILGGGDKNTPVADNTNMMDPRVAATYPGGHVTWMKGPNIRRNHWYDVLLHIKWGYESNGPKEGSVTWWLDGVHEGTFHGSNLFYAQHASDSNSSLGPGVTNAYLTAANYRAGCQVGDGSHNGYNASAGTCPNGPANRRTSEVFQDEYLIGSSEASVGGAPSRLVSP